MDPNSISAVAAVAAVIVAVVVPFLSVWAAQRVAARDQRQNRLLDVMLRLHKNVADCEVAFSKPRPRHVIEATQRGRLAKPVSEETRQRMSATHKQRGTRPPWLNPPWSKQEDALLRKLSPAEVVKQTGRTMAAIRNRRWQLGLKRPRAKSAPS